MNIKKTGLIFGVCAVAAVAFFPLRAALNPQDKEEIQNVIHQYLIENPEVIKEAIQALQQKEMMAMKQKSTDAIMQNTDLLFKSKSPSLDKPNADINIVEFFDYRCHYCKNMQKELQTVFSGNQTIRMVYKELPVLGDISVSAAKAALAANMQGKYVELHDKLFAEPQLTEPKIYELAQSVGLDLEKLKKDMQDPAVQDELTANMKLAQEIGVRGTPAFIVAKNPMDAKQTPVYLPGAFPASRLAEVIQNIKEGKPVAE